MEKTCKICESTDQVVSTQDGDFCREHYRIYKRRRAQGQMVEPDPRDQDIRVGGHKDC